MTSIIENIKKKGKDISILEGMDRIQYLVDFGYPLYLTLKI